LLKIIKSWFILLIMVREFKRLDVWKRAIVLGKRIYEVTKKFPDDEKYGLVSQLRRAVVGISSNIAEGCGRRTDKDTIQFLYIAMGSVKEVQSQLYISKEFGYLSESLLKELDDELEEISKMVMGFVNYISKENKFH